MRYRFPLYALPKDLISSDLGSFDIKWKGEQIAGRMDDNRFVPYYSRAEIEQGALRGRQLEIVWVDSAIDAFFLHIQGIWEGDLAGWNARAPWLRRSQWATVYCGRA